MSTALHLPAPILQFFDNNGVPLSGGSLSTFAAGTTTALATFSDPGLTTPNPVVITLDTAGRPSVSGSTVALFGAGATGYKFVVKDINGVTIPVGGDNIILPPTAAVAIPAPSSPNQVIRSTDGVVWTASDSPQLANLTLVNPLPLGSGGVGASLSATGGAHQFLKQSSVGASVTVVQPAYSDISGAPLANPLGVWDATKVVSTVYGPTATDGLVLATVSASSNGSGAVISGLTDGSNPPTTQRARAWMQRQDGTVALPDACLMFPVRKGDYWEVTYSLGSGTATNAVFFIPLGS